MRRRLGAPVRPRDRQDIERDRNTVARLDSRSVALSAQLAMYNQDASPLSNKPLADPFLQLLSMSPKTFPGEKAIPQIQSTSARSTASSSTPNACPQPSANSAPHKEFVPQQQTYGFNGPRWAALACHC